MNLVACEREARPFVCRFDTTQRTHLPAGWAAWRRATAPSGCTRPASSAPGSPALRALNFCFCLGGGVRRHRFLFWLKRIGYLPRPPQHPQTARTRGLEALPAHLHADRRALAPCIVGAAGQKVANHQLVDLALALVLDLVGVQQLGRVDGRVGLFFWVCLVWR